MTKKLWKMGLSSVLERNSPFTTTSYAVHASPAATDHDNNKTLFRQPTQRCGFNCLALLQTFNNNCEQKHIDVSVGLYGYY